MKKVKRIAKQRQKQAYRRNVRRRSALYTCWLIDPAKDEYQPNLREMFPDADTEGNEEACRNGIPWRWLDLPIPRSTEFPGEGPVDVRIVLNYPFTESVPQEFRERVVTATTPLDVCLAVRSMYEAVYAEDAKRGGLTVAQTRELDPTWALYNRKTGPWIYGHDIGDLVIHALQFDWKSAQRADVSLFIGS